MEPREALLDLDRAHRVDGRELPATPLDGLGDRGFRKAHGARHAYVGGAMANGIASVALVKALAREGFLAMFGAAGLPLSKVADAVATLQREADGEPWGVNLIHSPQEPHAELELSRFLDERGVRCVEASAYLRLTPAIVRYRARGLARGADGSIHAGNRVMAKVSRVEVARQFLAPAPEAMLAELVSLGEITTEQAALARQVPMCDDLTAEADSGGHTDNRPLVALLPTLLALRDRLVRELGLAHVPRVGAAGGIGTPEAAAAAYAMGAAYVVTGSINQACVESGSSDLVRAMLADAGQADFAMAPAADMFEMGVKVQVLKRGTMFPMRAGKLFELYQKHRTLDDIPPQERATLETQVFRAPLADVWAETRRYFEERDPREIARAERDPRHLMALVFRSYLGQASHWANAGLEARKFDFQVWAGPALGAFNEWARGSFLEAPDERRVATVAWNLVYGAAVTLRAGILRMQGAALPGPVWRPTPLATIKSLAEGAIP